MSLFFKINRKDSYRYSFADIIEVGEIEKSENHPETYFFNIKMKHNINLTIIFLKEDNPYAFENGIITDEPKETASYVRNIILLTINEIDDRTVNFS